MAGMPKVPYPEPPTQEAEVPQLDTGTQTPQASATVDVVDPYGDLGSIPATQLQDAIGQQYRLATPEDHAEFAKQQKYGTTEQQVKTGLEGFGQGLLGPVIPAAEVAMGVKPEDIRNRAEVNPGTHGTTVGAGLVAPALVTMGASTGARGALAGASKFTQSGLLSTAGETAAKAVGLSAPTSAVGRIGSAAVKGAIENMMFEAGDQATKAITQDPNQSTQSAAVSVGLAGLLGGGFGGAIGTAGPLWDAAVGSKVGGTLKALANKMGGIEGEAPSVVASAIEKSGMDIAPEIKSRLMGDPSVQQMSKTLEQSDTTASGLAHQKAIKSFQQQAGDTMAASLGRTPEQVEALSSDLSKYEAGKNIGKTLAAEYREQMDPLAKEFEALKDKYAPAQLVKDGEMLDLSNPAAPAPMPGTVSKMAHGISELAREQGWTVSPSSDIMKEVSRTLKELPNLNTLKDLGNYISRVGENTASTLPFGQQTPLSRAGSLIKNVLKDAESDIAMKRLGEEAPELIERYQAARAAYRAQSALKEALNDRLKVGGSTSGFAKGLKNMAETDGETLANRLSGKNDADLLQLLQNSYPKTAQAVREWHIDSALKAAADKAKPGEALNSNKLLSVIAGMSPEVRAFAIPEAARGRLEAIGTLLDEFNKLPHNFSNTARTMDKLMGGFPGAATGLATMLMGHGAPAAALVAALTKVLAKDAPDAARLATLKFLGSSKPVQAEGFGAAVNYISSVIKGEAAIAKATKNVFKAGAEVLSASQMPSDASKMALDKTLRSIQVNPQKMLDAGSKAAYYMPDHGQSVAQSSAQAVNYLNSIRPNTDKAQPLDSKREATSAEKADFNKALTIAQQPLAVLKSLSQGRMTPQDITHLKSIYPDLYTKLQTNLTHQMMDTIAKGGTINYQTRMGLSMFLNQPLDSTMTPLGITAAQLALSGVSARQGGQSQPPQGGISEAKGRGLDKLAGMYKTPVQKAQESRSGKSQ